MAARGVRNRRGGDRPARRPRGEGREATKPTRFHTDAASVAETIVAEVGRKIVLGLPLGLGKANHIANALFARAAADRSISLKILTALTLERPRPAADLHRRFIGPVAERLFGGYPPLAYAEALRKNELPANIHVSEFFFAAGQWLSVAAAQQAYISANYTHAARYLLQHGVNVIAQLVAKRRDAAGDTRFSLSCNPDITPDLVEARRAGAADFLLVGQVNEELPFMDGDAALPASEFSHVLEGPGCQFPLFGPPKLPVTTADYAAALNIARLVPDGGTLQIGIGSMGDAIAQGLILRHRENAAFRETIRRLAGPEGRLEPCEDAPFERGLYGLSEMLVDCFLDLIAAGVLKREAEGALLHAAFFLGPARFYRALREMPDHERARISMKTVSFVNALYGEEAEKRRARIDARFVNNAMMVTGLGAAISDGLDDGRVVSGVGGQHDFVTQAFALEGARSIITLNATRRQRGKAVSNIRWSYGQQTIPRHLRDIVVTEYGAADLRGKSDAAVVASLLEVTDSRFQDELLRKAKDAGKVPRHHEIPARHRDNTPERIDTALAPARRQGLLPAFPFGTDFTEVEQRLLFALERIKTASRTELARLAWRGALARRGTEGESDCLARMGLEAPLTMTHRLYRALIRGAIREEATGQSGDN